jgi:Fe-S oxidoreductase
VDIARLKAEYLAQSFKSSGSIPLKALVFGNVRILNVLGSFFAPLANAGAASGLGKWFSKQILSLDPRRSLPKFEESLARQWSPSTPGSRRVALFGDCFVMYNEPGIGLAAQRVLEAFGYNVELANAGCCGRAKISTGLLEQAIAEVDATIERLRPLIEDDSVEAILVAEPSCLSAMKDDWLELKLQTPMALREKLKAKAFLVEDFLEKQWGHHPRTPEFNAGPAPVLHGHCHQKALWGDETSAALLRRICGGVTVLDTGCCGMAGSFGFTTDRYDLSMKIGESRLFPAVRSATAPICAPGTSCRHQIHDGTAKHALHPIEVIAQRLKS